ncbi:hypothetical protein [Bacillus pumilus]|nr:hypothetical protein [Bacillus pumilus]
MPTNISATVLLPPIHFLTGGDSMTKKKGIFDVDADINLFKQGNITGIQEKLSGAKASTTVTTSKRDG